MESTEPVSSTDFADNPRVPPKQEPQSLPEKIGPFKIIALVYQSNMSVVYKAEEKNPPRTVALKTPILGRDGAHQRFRVETKVTADTFGAGIVPACDRANRWH